MLVCYKNTWLSNTNAYFYIFLRFSTFFQKGDLYPPGPPLKPPIGFVGDALK